MAAKQGPRRGYCRAEASTMPLGDGTDLKILKTGKLFFFDRAKNQAQTNDKFQIGFPAFLRYLLRKDSSYSPKYFFNL